MANKNNSLTSNFNAPKHNLLEIRNHSQDNNRAISLAFYKLSITLEEIHNSKRMVYDFSPEEITRDSNDDMYFFEKTIPFSKYFGNEYTDEQKESAIYTNLVDFAILGICFYLSNYDFKTGILNRDVAHNLFNDYNYILPSEEKTYYKSILVDTYDNGKLPEGVSYYHIYMNMLNKVNLSGNGRSNTLSKSTPAGRASASNNVLKFPDSVNIDSQLGNTGFGSSFAFISVVASLVIVLLGIIVYFSGYLG